MEALTQILLPLLTTLPMKERGLELLVRHSIKTGVSALAGTPLYLPNTGDKVTNTI